MIGYPSGQDGALGTTRCIPQAKFHQKPYNKSFIDQVCSVKMAGYWPRSFFASLWSSTSSRSINTQKKNNIPPSWPHTWSITHTYYLAHRKPPIAQWLEHPAGIWKVMGSTPVGGSENSLLFWQSCARFAYFFNCGILWTWSCMYLHKAYAVCTHCMSLHARAFALCNCYFVWGGIDWIVFA